MNIEKNHTRKCPLGSLVPNQGMAVVAVIAVEAPMSAPIMASGTAGPRGGGNTPIMEVLSISTSVSRKKSGIETKMEGMETTSTCSSEGACKRRIYFRCVTLRHHVKCEPLCDECDMNWAPIREVADLPSRGSSCDAGESPHGGQEATTQACRSEDCFLKCGIHPYMKRRPKRDPSDQAKFPAFTISPALRNSISSKHTAIAHSNDRLKGG